MQYRIIDGDKEVRVIIEGVLNFSASTEFKSMLTGLLSMTGRRLTFDLGNVSHIDSVGLGLLYIAKEDLTDIYGRITIKSPQESVKNLLELTEAHTDFEISA
jgi:anti-anti-sigma factor